ncbi:unnamed protein product [Mytilus coruscus]|uniref:Integrase catalytic domain-containing protein n=1 Tax=Mytilus coruscus TaxID=42192 RepID=A0A6J8E2V5_MYTCO|nr:unnamed protein product [Mytilus coruscus]
MDFVLGEKDADYRNELQWDDIQKIIRKRISCDDDTTYYVCLADMYHIVHEIHIATGHGRRDKIIKEANRKYANVSTEAVELLWICCPNIFRVTMALNLLHVLFLNIKDFWPECKMVHGKPRHSQSQGSVERANADMKDITVTWMRDNGCKDWPAGNKFV